jgi:hypothetical protein
MKTPELIQKEIEELEQEGSLELTDRQFAIRKGKIENLK